MRFDDGFQLFVGALAPEYVHTAMAKETFNSVLGTLYDRVKKNVLDDLRSPTLSAICVAACFRVRLSA